MRKSTLLPASLALVASLVLLPVPDAAAHERGHRDTVHRYSYYHHGHPRRALLPRWLRRDRDFVRWYELQPYRVIARLSWHKLHRRYLRDHAYHRLLARHYSYRDYRPYRGHGKERRRGKHRRRD